MIPENVLLPLIISTYFILFTGCEKEIPEIEKKQEIIISVNYRSINSSEIRKDIGSKVYIYYGLRQTDILNYKQDESQDGIIVHERDNSKVIKPDSIGEVDINGIFSIIPDKGIGYKHMFRKHFGLKAQLGYNYKHLKNSTLFLDDNQFYST